jgi:hypothetical protein
VRSYGENCSCRKDDTDQYQKQTTDSCLASETGNSLLSSAPGRPCGYHGSCCIDSTSCTHCLCSHSTHILLK